MAGNLPSACVPSDLLIVDDDQRSLMLLSELLRRNGHKVRIATDGELALRAIQARPPDLILLDIKMPDINGFDLLQTLKKDPGSMEIPVIMVSILSDSESIVTGFKGGCVDYITKPFREEEVIIRVNNQLEIKRCQGELRNANLFLEARVRERTEALEKSCQALQKAEKAIRESENRLQVIFDNASVIMMLLNDKAEVIMMNRPGFTAAGRPVEKMTGLRYGDILSCARAFQNPRGCGFGDECRKCPVRSTIERTFATNTNFYKVEATLVRKNNEEIEKTVLISTAIVDFDSPKTLLLTIDDITHRKIAERKLKQSELRYRSLFENNKMVMLLIDPENGDIIDANFSAVKFYGWSYEELTNKNIAEINCFSKDEIADEIMAATNENRNNYRFKHRRADNTIEDVEVYSWPVTIIDKQLRCSIIYDITDRLKTEREKEKLQERLIQAQKMEAIGNLAGGIAHDFNNILFPIIGMSELLLEDLSPASNEYGNVQEILNAGKRGSDLVKQILSFSRQAEQRKIPVRIQPILKQVIKLIRATIPSSIELHHNIQQDCGRVLVDATQLHQVAMNIITNAYHAVEATGGKISIHLEEVDLGHHFSAENLISSGRYALLSITDNGHGMTPDVMAKIFDPYFTTKEQGKGTGLGLAVALGIINAYKGLIKVYSKVGKGTTFKIYLPLVEKQNGHEKINISERPEAGNEHVLLVDDEVTIAKLEKEILERLGYKVTMRLNSIDVLEAFKANPGSYDLVISDMNMPNMAGDQLARALKMIRPDIPVIVCSGFSERLNKENAAAAGIDGFLMKPILISELSKTIRNVLCGIKG